MQKCGGQRTNSVWIGVRIKNDELAAIAAKLSADRFHLHDMVTSEA